MKDNDTAAQPAAPNADLVALQQEMARREAITQLCALAGASVTEANAYIASTKSAEDVRKELAARQPAPTPINGAVPGVSGGKNREADKPFASLGEQLQAIAFAGMGQAPASMIERLHNVRAAATGGSATVGADGGFLIQKDFTTELLSSGIETGVLLSRCSETEVGANADGLEVVTTDQKDRRTGHRWGGVQVYRRAEAETVNVTKPELDKWECRLEDLMGIAYMTDRLIQDAPAMQSVYEESFNEEFAWTGDNEVYRGTGAGQMLGVLTALDSSSKGPTISVAKETGQASDSIVAENFMNMWKCVDAQSRLNGIWVYNQELEPQLQSMQIGTGTSAQLVYMPPGGISGAQYGTIYGRPIIPIEHASAPGDVGDVAFLNLDRFKVIRKGGVQQDESIHVRFVYGERAFRWVARINGKPKDKSARRPAYGSTNFRISPFVTLAAR